MSIPFCKKIKSFFIFLSTAKVDLFSLPSLLQQGLTLSEIGQNALYKRIEGGTVVMVADVRKLVNNDIINCLFGVHHDAIRKAKAVFAATAPESLLRRCDLDRCRCYPHQKGIMVYLERDELLRSLIKLFHL